MSVPILGRGGIMSITIKELRENTGLSQTLFAKKYEIPVSALRKWEQGESKPAPYIIKMLSEIIPTNDKYTMTIKGKNGVSYYYDEYSGVISDSVGNTLKVKCKLKEVKKENLPLYVQDLFESYYDAVNRFERDCVLDKKSNIIWS